MKKTQKLVKNSKTIAIACIVSHSLGTHGLVAKSSVYKAINRRFDFIRMDLVFACKNNLKIYNFVKQKFLERVELEKIFRMKSNFPEIILK